MHTYTYDNLSDVKTVNLELGETMRQHRKGSDFGAGLEHKNRARLRKRLSQWEERPCHAGLRLEVKILLLAVLRIRG